MDTITGRRNVFFLKTSSFGYKGFKFPAEEHLTAGFQSPTTPANHEQMLSSEQKYTRSRYVLTRAHKYDPKDT